MKGDLMKYLLAIPLTLAATAAQASPTIAPEMNISAGMASLVLLAGVVAIVREKINRK